jgi:signal peptidase I
MRLPKKSRKELYNFYLIGLISIGATLLLLFGYNLIGLIHLITGGMVIMLFRGEKHNEYSSMLIKAFVIYLFVVIGFVVHIFFMMVLHVPSNSMESAFLAGDHVLVRRFFSRNGIETISRNDILVFRSPFGEDRLYVKRCIGLPGDTVQIICGSVFVNGKSIVEPQSVLNQYTAWTKDWSSFQRACLDTLTSTSQLLPAKGPWKATLLLTNSLANQLVLNGIIDSLSIKSANQGKGSGVLGSESVLKWTIHNFGPFVVPFAGMKIEINDSTRTIYTRLLNNTTTKNTISDTIVIADNHFFLLGDNRNNSSDSRYWGTLPSSHLVGVPVLILWSRDYSSKGIGGYRWKRFFQKPR